MVKVYAYSGCSTCRKALKFLADRGIAHVVVPIREEPPTAAELKRMLALCGGELRRLFNTSGQDYRALQLGPKLASMPTADALALLAKNGNLVKRPFVLTHDGGLAGFDEARWNEFFSVASKAKK